MLGVGNAATPFGLKAMQEMQKMQQQAPMGGGEEVIADSAAVDTTNVKLQN